MNNNNEGILFSKLSIAGLLSVFVITGLFASYAKAEAKATDQYVYIGGEFGLSEPIWKQFDYKDDQNRKTRIGLKNSKMLGGRVGWSFYPNMIIEVSGTHQPKHVLTYRLPSVPSSFIPGFVIPETLGRTRVTANVYIFNFIYKLPDLEFYTIKPYVIGGGGIALVRVHPTFSNVTLPPKAMLGSEKIEFFRIKKTKTKCPTYQAGIGLTKEIGKYLEIDLSSKFQVAQDIKINYDVLVNPITGQFQSKKPIKKTIAVGEFTLGILFKLPV